MKRNYEKSITNKETIYMFNEKINIIYTRIVTRAICFGIAKTSTCAI